jgi:hypothetical protein
MIDGAALPALLGSGVRKIREPIRVLRLDRRQQQVLLEVSDAEIRYQQSASGLVVQDVLGLDVAMPHGLRVREGEPGDDALEQLESAFRCHALIDQ